MPDNRDNFGYPPFLKISQKEFKTCKKFKNRLGRILIEVDGDLKQPKDLNDEDFDMFTQFIHKLNNIRKFAQALRSGEVKLNK